MVRYVLPVHSKDEFSTFLKYFNEEAEKIGKSFSAESSTIVGALCLSNLSVQECQKYGTPLKMADIVGAWVVNRRGSGFFESVKSIVAHDDMDFGHDVRVGSDTLHNTADAANKGFGALLLGLLGIELTYVIVDGEHPEKAEAVIANNPVPNYGLLPWAARSALPLWSDASYARASLLGTEKSLMDAKLRWTANRLAVAILRPICGTAAMQPSATAALAIALPGLRVRQEGDRAVPCYIGPQSVVFVATKTGIRAVPRSELRQELIFSSDLLLRDDSVVEFGFAELPGKDADLVNKIEGALAPAWVANDKWATVVDASFRANPTALGYSSASKQLIAQELLYAALVADGYDEELVNVGVGSLHDWFGVDDALGFSIGAPVHASSGIHDRWIGPALAARSFSTDAGLIFYTSAQAAPAFGDSTLMSQALTGVKVAFGGEEVELKVEALADAGDARAVGNLFSFNDGSEDSGPAFTLDKASLASTNTVAYIIKAKE